MNVLLVKLTSLGDVVHTFAALTDLAAARPDVRVDWLVDLTLADIARLHPAPAEVIGVGLRSWRAGLPGSLMRGRPLALARRLRAARYDLVVDAQGLIKSAVLAALAGAPVCGLDTRSAREPLASRLYSRRVYVPGERHAVERTRDLLAAALDYPRPAGVADSGLPGRGRSNTVLLLHGTTWATKHWPLANWAALAQRLGADGYEVRVPHANDAELARAEYIVAAGANVQLLPRTSLVQMADHVTAARAVVGVDSGLLHLAAAAGVPAIGLYGPTDAQLTGAVGPLATNLQATLECVPCRQPRCARQPIPGGSAATDWPPCLALVTPDSVADRLYARLAA